MILWNTWLLVLKFSFCSLPFLCKHRSTAILSSMLLVF
jgi:hypothetical protein